MEVIQGVHQIKIPLPAGSLDHVNAYVLQGDKGNVLIDTGFDTPEAFAAVRDGLKMSGRGFKDITHIIITHIHPDHYGMAAKLKQMSGATVAFTETEEKLLESRYQNPDNLLAEMRRLLESNGVPQELLPGLAEVAMPLREFVGVVAADTRLNGGEKISLGSTELRVIVTPGHSPGHICLYEPKRKFLFSGDHVLPDITSHVGYHPQSGENPLGDFLAALEALSQLDITLVFPGHGSVFSGIKLRINELLYHHRERERAIVIAAEDEMKTAYQIASEILWMPTGEPIPFSKLSNFDKRLAVLETLAHLKYLMSKGKAQKFTKDGIDLYWTGE